ncbi:MAG: glutaredoxin domain-containing protein [Verrucomicrobiota bacterium]
MSHIRPTLYVKTGCPWCQEAVDTLNQLNVPYDQVIVSGNADAMARMVELSGQTKAPTMDWGGEILADFGAEELIPFLKERGVG